VAALTGPLEPPRSENIITVAKTKGIVSYSLLFFINNPPFISGGLVSNSELLLESYDSEFIKLILKSNEKRKKELEDPEIAEEANKIRKIVDAFHAEITKVRSASQ